MSFHNKVHHNKNITKQFISWYASKLQTHPITTKTITSGIIAGAGDLTCQYIIQRQMFYNSIDHDVVHHQSGSSSSITSINQNLKQNDQLHHEQHLYNSEWGETMSSSFFIFQPDLIRTSRFAFLGFALSAPVVHVSSTRVSLRSCYPFISIRIFSD